MAESAVAKVNRQTPRLSDQHAIERVIVPPRDSASSLRVDG
jgi:hypothetical protein